MHPPEQFAKRKTPERQMSGTSDARSSGTVPRTYRTIAIRETKSGPIQSDFPLSSLAARRERTDAKNHDANYHKGSVDVWHQDIE
jgi:hypothetical protein